MTRMGRTHDEDRDFGFMMFGWVLGILTTLLGIIFLRGGCA